MRSQVEAMSARSWVRVLASPGPCMARAAVVVRSQMPAAWAAGRYAESQAIPSRSGAYSTRRSAALAGVVSSTMIRACCHDKVPAWSADSVRGRALVRSRASNSRALAARSLMVRTPAISEVVAISLTVWSCADSAGDAMASSAAA